MCVCGVCMWEDQEYSGRFLSLSNGRMAGAVSLFLTSPCSSVAVTLGLLLFL